MGTTMDKHAAGVSEIIKSTWYAAIHGIIPTNERLAAIRQWTRILAHAAGKMTPYNTVTECEEGPVIWNWTRARTVALLRVDPKHIPAKWTLRPTFHYWPVQKQAAIIWILVHLVAYRLQTQRHLSLLDYMDFLKRARWKGYHRTSRRPEEGRYLDVL